MKFRCEAAERLQHQPKIRGASQAGKGWDSRRGERRGREAPRQRYTRREEGDRERLKEKREMRQSPRKHFIFLL